MFCVPSLASYHHVLCAIRGSFPPENLAPPCDLDEVVVDVLPVKPEVRFDVISGVGRFRMLYWF